MKRADHVREIGDAARSAGIEMALIRQGGEHEVWRCGGVQFSIPRHRELTPGVVANNRSRLAAVFGEGWWRR